MYRRIYALLIPVFMGNGIKILLQEYMLDQDYTHFLFLILVPVLFAISLVSTLTSHAGVSTHAILFAVLYSPTRPESRDVNWSNRTLPRELAILLRDSTQTKQRSG